MLINIVSPDRDDDDGPRNLYSVLPEQEIRAKGFFGGQHAYDLSKNPNLPVLGQEDQQRKVIIFSF